MFDAASKEYVEKRIHDFFDHEAEEVTRLMGKIVVLELEVSKLTRRVLELEKKQ